MTKLEKIDQVMVPKMAHNSVTAVMFRTVLEGMSAVRVMFVYVVGMPTSGKVLEIGVFRLTSFYQIVLGPQLALLNISSCNNGCL